MLKLLRYRHHVGSNFGIRLGLGVIRLRRSHIIALVPSYTSSAANNEQARARCGLPVR